MKKKLFSFILILILGLSLSACAKKTKVDNDPVYSFHTELQEAYLKDSYSNFALYANGTENLSTPNAIVLSWDDSVISPSDSYIVKISENADFKAYKEYKTKENKVPIYNLKIATKYYYTISNGTDTSSVIFFNVKGDAPRNLNVDGLTNVRDVGGWKAGNSRVKQNLLFRSSKFNDDESTELVISEEGINILVNDFHIKTEIDLRKTSDNENGGITSSPLGNSVNYVSIPMKSSGNVLTLNPNEVAQVFKLLADENNYPIIFHCSIGTDRTGLIAFLVNALLGVSEEDLYRDYLFSNFGLIYDMRTPSAVKNYLNAINMKSGDTLKDRTFNYLKSIGLSEKELNNIIKIMTE